MSLRRGETRFFAMMIMPALAVVGLFSLYPIILVFRSSFSDMRMMIDPFNFVGLKNFFWVFSNPYFQTATLNTSLFMLGSIVFQTGFGILFAAILNNSRLRGVESIRNLLLFAWLIPELVAAIIMGFIFSSNVGILNHWLGLLGLPQPAWLSDTSTALMTLVIINIWKGLPFNIMIYLTAMKTINGELYEAATIDGARPAQQFRVVTLPAILPTIRTTLVLGMIWTSSVFFIPFITTGGGPVNSTLLWSLAIYETTFANQQAARGAAMSVVVFLALTAVSLIYMLMTREESTS